MRPTIRVRPLVLALAFVVPLVPSPAHALWIQTGTQTWPGGVVPVCYTAKVAAQPNFSAFLNLTRNAVINTWGRAASLQFTGWAECPATPPAGSIVIEYVPCGFQGQTGYNPSGPTLYTVDFNNSDPGGRCNSGDNSTTARWAYFAGHEFGHMLGFEHEQDRLDNRTATGGPLCNVGIDKTNPGTGNLLGTPVDTRSVMSYCGPVYGVSSPIGMVPPLSPWDIDGVQNAYGRKPPGSIAGLDDHCVVANDTAWPSPLVGGACDGTSLSTWTRSLDPARQNFSTWFPFAAYPNRCIDVPNASISFWGTPLQDYPCNDSVAQQMTLDNVQWKAIGDQCVSVRSTATNSVLEIQPCGTPGFYQQWSFDNDGGGAAGGTRIKLAGTGMCVNVPYASATSGNPLELYPCGSPTPYPNEVYTLTSNGEIEWGGMCMNVWGGVTTPGAQVKLYACMSTPADNERFHVSGPIHGMGGTCLDRDTLSDAIELTSCDASPGQSWDYYFTGWSDY